jgi:hypothetical protein
MRKLFLALLLLITPTFCLAENDPQLLIYGQQISFGAAKGSIPNTGFFIDRSWLNASPEWNPDQNFPLKLGTVARQEASTLKREKGLDSDIDLNMVGIWRCPIPSIWITNEPDSNRPHHGNLCFVVFNYAVRNMGPFVTSVVLLNGKYASEKDLTKLATASSNSGAQTFGTADRAGILSPVPAMPFLQRLHSPDLHIPLIQWDPTLQEFPADIGRLVRLAMATLQEKYTLTNVELLKFYDVTMYRFVPDEAVSAQGLTIRGNSHHWLIAVRFKAQATNEVLAAYLLLDGTIVETSRNKWPRFQN